MERLILKKTSLLLSVTLILRCSGGAGASPPAGLPLSFSPDMFDGLLRLVFGACPEVSDDVLVIVLFCFIVVRFDECWQLGIFS